MYYPEPNPIHKNKPFLNSVYTLRSTTGLSQEAFARLCGIKYSTMKRYDRGEQPLSYEDKEKIERATFEKVELYYDHKFTATVPITGEDYKIMVQFFKTFGIKQRWFDTTHDFKGLSLGHYKDKTSMIKTLMTCNGWNKQETERIADKECYLAYPRITDEKLFELIVLLSEYSLVLNKVTDKGELINLVLYNCISRKERLKKKIQSMFPLPELNEDEAIKLKENYNA